MKREEGGRRGVLYFLSFRFDRNDGQPTNKFLEREGSGWRKRGLKGSLQEKQKAQEKDGGTESWILCHGKGGCGTAELVAAGGSGRG